MYFPLHMFFPVQLHSSNGTNGIDSGLRPDREYKTLFTEYCTSGDIIGELCCLLRRELEYSVVCETTLQVRNWFCLYHGLLVNSSSKK